MHSPLHFTRQETLHLSSLQMTSLASQALEDLKLSQHPLVRISTTHNYSNSHHHPPHPTSSLSAKHQIPCPLSPNPHKYHQTILGPQANSPN